ncbi:MAG: hypothetical protein FJY17_11035 [Bacteroidetes bacterium]|nr:hypothetical protein [Bacteroidota bacterium]
MKNNFSLPRGVVGNFALVIIIKLFMEVNYFELHLGGTKMIRESIICNNSYFGIIRGLLRMHLNMLDTFL